MIKVRTITYKYNYGTSLKCASIIIMLAAQRGLTVFLTKA